MGLDMYLYKKHFIWSNDKTGLKITGLKNKIDGSKVRYIVEEAGYWRKANAIHQWFVNNVQNGVDDCGNYYVSKEDLERLRDIVNEVLKHSELVEAEITNGQKYDPETKEWTPIKEMGKTIKDPSTAAELLPTTEGFFFGSTDYNEFYYDDLVLTKEIIDEALKDDSADYEYTSSW